MAKSRIFLYIIIIFYLYDTRNANFTKNMTFYKIRINGTEYENFKIGNIRIFKDNLIFCSFPRKDNSLGATFASTNSNNEVVKIFEPYPNEEINKYNETNCDNLFSVISFEIDQEGKIYLLDEGIKENDKFKCNPKLIIYKDKKEIYRYILQIETKKEIQLEDFLIDKINNYTYITYHDVNASGIFLINLKIKDDKDKKHISKITNIKNLLYDDEKLKAENGYILKIKDNELEEEFKKIKSIGLSCDGDAFFFSFISSKMIYSVLTKEIYQKFESDKKEIKDITIYEAYKNDATSTIIYSNMGNLFLTGLEKNKIYSYDLIDNDLSRFDYKGLRELNTSGIDIIFPLKMTFNDGKLYLLTSNINSSIYTIYYDEINEKSYIYGCAGLKYKFNLSFYIMLSIFFLILLFVLTFVIVGNIQDKDINKKNN
jgi:hypothetical protein